jgi:hypothetical protein
MQFKFTMMKNDSGKYWSMGCQKWSKMVNNRKTMVRYGQLCQIGEFTELIFFFFTDAKKLPSLLPVSWIGLWLSSHGAA